MDFITIESHFGVPENAIRPETRNLCSKDLVAMIYRTAEILYPDEKIEVLILPSEIGSYKDILKIIGKTTVGVATIAGSVFAYLTYRNSNSQNKVDMIKSCIETMQQVDGLSGTNISVDNEILNLLCEDYGVSRIKNSRYKTLEKDETIKYEETSIKSIDNKILLQEKVERTDFSGMIIPLPEDEDYEKENIEAIIELIALVVKQKKDGKGRPWQGIYYGESITHYNISILESNEEFSFYMQDHTFKEEIKAHLITFGNGDNIEVEMKLKAEIRGGAVINKSIYVTKVLSFNSKKIIHKIKSENPYVQGGLFS